MSVPAQLTLAPAFSLDLKLDPAAPPAYDVSLSQEQVEEEEGFASRLCGLLGSRATQGEFDEREPEREL